MTDRTYSDAGPSRPASRAGFTARDLLTPAFYYWKPALLVFLIPVILALMLAAIAKPIYTAQSRLLILPGDDYVFRGGVAGNGPSQVFDRAQIVNAEIEILKSRDLQERAIRAVGMQRVYPAFPDTQRGMDQALERLSKDLRIENVPASNVIELHLRHRDARISADLLNRLVELYIRDRRDVFERSDVKAAREQQADLQMRLSGVEDRIAAFSNEHQLGDYNQELIAVQTQQTALAGQIHSLDQQLSAAGGRAGRLAGEIRSAPREITLNIDSARSQQVESLTTALMALKEQRRVAAARYRDGYPLVAELDRQIAGLEGAIEAAPPQQTALVRRGANPVYQELDTQLATTRGEAAALEAARAKAAQSLGANGERLAQLIRIGPQYRELLRDRALLEGAYQDIARRSEDVRLEGALAGAQANVRIIQRAEPPTKGRAGRLILLAAGVVLGGLAALAVIVLSAATQQVMVTPADVEAKLDLPILASVPQGANDAPRAPLWRPTPGRMTADDANILHRLLRSVAGDGPAVMQWIAADDGEGVSTLALDMALHRAQRSRAKVLLVDVEPAERGGLADLLKRGGASLEVVSRRDRILRVNDSNLYVTAPLNLPGRPLPEERWAALLTAARQTYPLIVVDSPPVQRSAAGVLLAPLADLTLAVVEAERTRAPVVENLIRRIESAGGTVFGVVLNKRRFYIPQFLYARL
ncbi:GumC family protein [Caulobacter mirabilis]|uniref:Polysaccharide chain length determinant N-terminal domain-containing protein n=1 Tax=Caulobacter mirabilis TaxID=69666 RepID=A0A2D2AZ57_9CAUL|nr:tyrosine-protein kinase domain-containing protein [Caulobacter mirabilis]ATQ43299.1 hypothetical protein CSW64_13155 [Caulobacter mirabilis]